MTASDTLPQLTGERLTLRVPAPQDRSLYASFYAVSETTVGGYRGNRSDAEISAIHTRDMAHWDKHGFGIFLIHDTADGTFYGGTGIAYPTGWQQDELTWWLMPAARGKGVATRASRTVITWAYDTLGWSRVQTYMRDENAPARALAQRLGGRITHRDTFPDGVTRDVFVLPRTVA
nr:GNAT family N-acetyltransferase [Sulfitobacter aestuariivivens]